MLEFVMKNYRLYGGFEDLHQLMNNVVKDVIIVELKEIGSCLNCPRREVKHYNLKKKKEENRKMLA